MLLHLTFTNYAIFVIVKVVHLNKWIPTTISKYPTYVDAKHTPKTKKKQVQQNKMN